MPEYNIPLGFRFEVKFSFPENGNTQGNQLKNDIAFQEVTGLTAELGIETLEEGGENMFTHRLPTRAKYENLVLKRGMFKDSELITWFNDAVLNFTFKTANVTVVLLNEKRKPLEAWNFKNVWPVKWSISDLKAQENALVIETLELAYSSFDRGLKQTT